MKSTILILIIPFLGTALGSAMVFFLKKEMKPFVKKILVGFAAGVMIAASIWSLLIPASEMAEEQGKIAWIPTSVGFLFGIVFLLVLDSIIPHLHQDQEKPEGLKSSFKKTTNPNVSPIGKRFGPRCFVKMQQKRCRLNARNRAL